MPLFVLVPSTIPLLFVRLPEAAGAGAAAVLLTAAATMELLADAGPVVISRGDGVGVDRGDDGGSGFGWAI
jgi:hypothetical protein